VALFLTSQEVDESRVSVKEGTAISARCISSRSVNGVKFRVEYSDGELVDDYISLPFGFSCDAEFVERFENKTLVISYYDNYYLGFEVDGLLVRAVGDAIDEVNDKKAVLIFTFVVALAITFPLYILGRNHDAGASRLLKNPAYRQGVGDNSSEHSSGDAADARR